MQSMKGFTLIELIIVTMICGIVLALFIGPHKEFKSEYEHSMTEEVMCLNGKYVIIQNNEQRVTKASC